MIKWFKAGTPWIWLTAGAVSLSLLAVLGLLLLIGWKGLSFFWPAPVYQFDIAQQGHHSTVIGEIYQRQSVPVTQLHEAGIDTTGFTGPAVDRLVIKSGNRELRGSDFVTVLQPHIAHQAPAAGVIVIERLKNGRFYGYPVALMDDGKSLPLSQLPTSWPTHKPFVMTFVTLRKPISPH
ncbi:phosphate transport system permease protein PstA [Photobacterium aphoticum]|uniref:Phosphate transport system permease protein PstA n=1 Tax=Photobacterium aphoticum TaxID=754436 RepID=A0A090QZJ3_9GAMM|nr:phosphate transport system permease protein PstA [Photobacterium aphoticum]